MSDFTVVDPQGWEYDLHSVYSAYIGYFQLHNIAWYDRSWGHLFSSFEEFLSFSWPVITVTDAWTGKPHIVTRLTSIGAFLKMIKTRFGETLSQAPNILQVTPFETTTRHLRHISDHASYKRLHSTLPAAVLSALKTRVRAGEPKAVRSLWEGRDKTFLAIDFEWSERNEKSCLEWGYAAVRCGHLDALGHWPPNPDTNYRKGHYIIGEYVDKVVNKHCPTFPWHYAFGESQIAPKAKLPQIIQAVISSLASPDSETTPNTLVLVAHGIGGDLARLDEMKIKLPHNVLILDTAAYERMLHSTGHRGLMSDPKTGKPRVPGSTISLENMLRSFASSHVGTESPVPPHTPTTPLTGTPNTNLNTNTHAHMIHTHLLPNVRTHNAGNDAFLCLFALQMLLEPAGTKVPLPVPRKRVASMGLGMGGGMGGMVAGRPASMMMLDPGAGVGVGYGVMGMVPSPGMGMGMGMVPSASMGMIPSMSPSMNLGMTINIPTPPAAQSSYDLAGESAEMGVGRRSPGGVNGHANGNGSGVNGKAGEGKGDTNGDVNGNGNGRAKTLPGRRGWGR
ncbi:hypothetical protein Hypma_008383 [Hypsizygus marmoreus]|uniref:Gfd2/YDR514C-like C-terminal domain-containing protein n=1 Tax=Hypsizygus marmoreus TaxID=39966 RepID=A0A369JSZ0_HYPMA|nr:hypothetical protein Hypma_008383 [Hypsizygus marmoreus]